jgi:hypothetical protein
MPNGSTVIRVTSFAAQVRSRPKPAMISVGRVTTPCFSAPLSARELEQAAAFDSLGCLGYKHCCVQCDGMIDVAERFLAPAEQQRASGPLMIGHRLVGMSSLHTGEIAKCLTFLRPMVCRTASIGSGQGVALGVYPHLVRAIRSVPEKLVVRQHFERLRQDLIDPTQRLLSEPDDLGRIGRGQSAVRPILGTFASR